jgi:MoaA/NifB/PqqE/SkfB family radical SAM enzyme
LTLRILKAFVDLLILKKQPLRYVDINIGLACNLRCAHCFAENFKFPGALDLSPEEWRSVFEQLLDLGCIALAFTGGEPLAYLDRLLHLISLAKPDRSLLIVCSNGTLLTPAIAKQLKDAGLDIIQLSLDSGIAEEHDAFRGASGVYAKTIAAVDIAQQAGLRVAVVPTVSHQNLHTEGFRKLIEWTKEKDILVNLAMAAPVGNWHENEACRLTPQDIEDLDKLVESTPHVRRDFETNYWWQGCGAGTEKLYFTPFGDVLPCPFMHISFGNVRESSVAAIRNKMLANRFLAGYYPRCLTAEDAEFMDNFLPRELLQGHKLPTAEEVFSADAHLEPSEPGRLDCRTEPDPCSHGPD